MEREEILEIMGRAMRGVYQEVSELAAKTANDKEMTKVGAKAILMALSEGWAIRATIIHEELKCWDKISQNAIIGDLGSGTH